MANAVVGNVVADTLIKLRGKLAQRVAELDSLCSANNRPETRLKAIMMWCKLAGVDRAMPDPTTPTNPKSLELIEDILEDKSRVG